MKRFFRASIILACVYLSFAGIFNLTRGYPQHINIDGSPYAFFYFIPRITYLIHIALSIFTLVKLFFYKQFFIKKLVSVVLAVTGFIQIFVIIMYFYSIRRYFNLFSYPTIFQIANYTALIIIALLMIFISINTFRPFISNKTALIFSACVFIYRMVVYLATTLWYTYLIENARLSIKTLIFIILGAILIDLAVFWASYNSLKTTDGFISISEEKA